MGGSISQRRYRKLLFLVAVILITAVIVGVAWMKHTVRLVLQNETQQRVDAATVIIGEQVYRFEDLEPGERAERWFFYDGPDSSIKMEATLDSGMIMKGHYGTVSHGPGLELALIQLNQNGSQTFVQRPLFE